MDSIKKLVDSIDDNIDKLSEALYAKRKSTPSMHDNEMEDSVALEIQLLLVKAKLHSYKCEWIKTYAY